MEPPKSGRDRIARVLYAVRMRSTFYCHAELSAPWALEMPAISNSASFHVVTNGVCHLQVGSVEHVELRAGDLALVPHGRGHLLLSDLDVVSARRVDLLPQTYLSEHYSLLRHGGGGSAAELICGVVSFDAPVARELLTALPAVLVVDGEATSPASSVRDTLRLMANELSMPQPGGDAVATRLADVVVVQAIRDWITARADASEGWFRAVQDERIGRVIEAIHDDPGGRWTVATLAQIGTMSRSSFSARFAELAGESPIAYLTRWRMQVARSRLLDEDVTATRLARDLGYQSEAAFNRAFVRVTGQTPGSIRKARRFDERRDSAKFVRSDYTVAALGH